MITLALSKPLKLVAEADVYAPQAGTNNKSPIAKGTVIRPRNIISKESQLGPAKVAATFFSPSLKANQLKIPLVKNNTGKSAI